MSESGHQQKDRFSEKHAAGLVRGSTPDLKAGRAAIRTTVSALHAEPGVYRMLDEKEQVLYVGKAKSLKARVANYLQVERLPRRLQRMVAQTRSMTVVTTNSESEALLLEAQLIKRFRPPYNVLLRDDKSFPFIALDEGHNFPRLTKHRGARKASTRYYGPFASAGAVDTTLNALQKMFLLRSCSDSYMANRTRPCLLHQIGRCSAPCVDRINADDYAELVQDAKSFLSGRSQEVQNKLKAKMTEAAEVQDYELAAIFRDRLRALTAIQGTQALNLDSETDADVIALSSEGNMACIQIFFIRGGQNWGHRAIFPAHVGDVEPDEILTAFLSQFYAELIPAPLIMLDRELSDVALMAEAFSEKSGRKVELRVPKRGHWRRLIDQASRNAHQAIERRLAESASQRENLDRLAELLDLPAPPQRIEIYDNSHVMGTHALGAMVVAGPEGFIKSAYRKFNMKAEDITAGDDFAMMRAMLHRRFARLANDLGAEEDGNSLPGTEVVIPDLLLIDGGKGQVSSATEALAETGFQNIPIIGISQGADRSSGRETFHLPGGREFTLPMNDPLLYFLQRLRDEAHRFAIGSHRSKRSKAMTASSLDDIPGVGPARKKALLMHFGTAHAVKGASVEALAQTSGISKAIAEAIYSHFHPNRL